MPIIASDAPVGYTHRRAPEPPLVVNAAEHPSVETVPAGPPAGAGGGAARVAVLALPGGIRICVDPASADVDAARWWHELGVSALLAAMYYDEGECGSRSAR
jgi:hypothetical protein